MKTRHVRSAVTAGLLTFGLAALGPVSGRAQQATVLPDGETDITVVGCFAKDHVKGHDKWVLANPTIGPATTVPESACTTTGGAQMIKLEKVKKHHFEGFGLIGHRHGKDVYGAGQWAEVTGRLEKVEGDADNLRELKVSSIRMVPVAVPQPVAEVIPAPAPEPIPAPAPMPEVSAAPAPAPAPAPVATTGVVEGPKKTLPKTASPLPIIALLGFVSLLGGLTLLADRRRSLGRG